MKRIAIAAVVIVAVIAAVLVVAPAFVETGFVKGKVTKAVAEATGRRLDLVGSARFSLVPRVAVSISDAALSGPGGEGEMVRLAGLDVGVALLPMLSGRLEVTGVRLREPVITLEVDAAGRPNWDFQKPAGDGATAAPAEPGAPAAGGGFDPAAFWLGRVDIENGTLVYRDAASGRDERVEAIDLSARLPSPTDESEITGSVRYKGETVTIDAGIDGPGALLADGAAPLRLALAGDKAKLEAKGTLAPKAVTAFEGDVSAAIPSLDALFDWLGLAAAPRGLGAASLDTRLFAGEKAIAAEGLRLGLAGGTLTADASLSLFGARPRIDARGVVDRLDLDRLTSAAAPAPAAGSGKADAAKADAADAPIDLSALAALDAAVELDIGELVVSGAEARNVGLGVELVDRRLELSLFDAKALGGRARARLVADATRKTPAFAGTVMLDGLDLEAIGKVAARPLPASGAASLDMSFSARGATRAALAKSLDGKGTLRLADGRVAGLGLKDAVGGDPAADVVEKINIRADFASLAAPVKATGSLVWRGERFDVKAGLSPRAFLEDGRTEASVDVVAKRLEAGFSGTVAAGAKTALAGRVRLKTASLRDLLAWVGQPLAPGAGLGRFAIDGVLEAGPETVTFSDATIALDGSSGTGEGR
ncbi:MAG TPA: AsmA family protein, partial [Kaistiaceae bacterium]|nr:AsmA family protein [Kaistiaceae bacterium]